MGLDMYLKAGKYISKIDYKKTEDVDTPVHYPQYDEIVSIAGMQKIQDKGWGGAEVKVNCAYWRKSNQIHDWFVRNVQEGDDDCGEYYVSNEKLVELLDTCRDAYKRKDPSKLMPQGGFFFGSTDIDQWYWEDIKDTIKQLDRLVNLPEFEELSFYYHSSW